MSKMMRTLEGIDGDRAIFRLNGKAERSPELDDMADDALQKLGVKKGRGFQFIEIWSRAGRAGDLAPDPQTGHIVTQAIAAVGGVFFLMALFGWRKGNAPAPVKQSRAMAGLDAAIAAKTTPGPAPLAAPTASRSLPKPNVLFLLSAGFLLMVGLFPGNLKRLGVGAVGCFCQWQGVSLADSGGRLAPVPGGQAEG